MLSSLNLKSGIAVLLLPAVLAFATVQANEVFKSPAAPEGASIRIIYPGDGAELTSPFTVVFGMTGMGVAPAGVEREKTGHHHLLVDQEELPKLDAVMGNPPLHFGGGQTETTLELEPGEHTLQLILGNHLHVPFSPMILSKKITVTVK